MIGGVQRMNLKFDRVASIVFLVLGILIIIESQKISESAYGSQIGPSTFPFVLGIVLIGLSILLFFETIRHQAMYKIVQEQEGGKSSNFKRFLIIFISAVAYAFLLEKLGYLITTFAFLLISFQTLERGKWVSSIIVAAAFSAIIYFGFVNVLGGSLPKFPL